MTPELTAFAKTLAPILLMSSQAEAERALVNAMTLAFACGKLEAMQSLTAAIEAREVIARFSRQAGPGEGAEHGTQGQVSSPRAGCDAAGFSTKET